MSSIDKRIVQMQFDNQGFESGVSTTMKSLNKLNESLKMKDASTNLGGISNSMRDLASIGLGGLASGVNSVSSRFSALGIMGVTALMNITNSAVNAGKSLLHSLTLEPITTGFSEYETKMNAIQTILTNTASKGTTMEDVTATLNELNKYADQTIYNFAEMTRNIGTFTAAGIDLETSATAIKGIANLAAGSGSNAQQASTAMYQLSQALAAGKVSLMDWNSVVNAGMGGELFQNALKETAKQMGIYVDKSKPFRETLQDGWLTAKVLTKTLTKFAEDESLLKAATEVKTFTQLLDTMKESVQSGWATSWEYIVGDKEQAASFFTAISDGFNKMIQPSTDARNAMLKFWNENGGRTAIIDGLANVMESFQKIMRGIGMAWDMVFPPMTGQKLVELSKGFKELTEKFKITDQMAGKIGRVFKGLFDAMAMVGEGIVALFKGFAPMKEAFKGAGTSVLDTVSNFGGALSDMRDKVANTDFLGSFVTGMQSITTKIAEFILNLKDNIGKMIDYIWGLDFEGFFDGVGKVFNRIGDLISPVFDQIANTIGKINFDTVFDLMKFGVAAKALDTIKAIFGDFVEGTKEAKGIFETIKDSISKLSEIGSTVAEVLDVARESITAWQQNLKASILLKIGAALLMLAAGLLLISSINPEKLIVGIAGISVLFAELTLAFIAMSKFGDMKGVAKIGGFLIAFAASIAILGVALKTLSSIEPDKMAVGIIGLVTALGVCIIAAKTLGKGEKQLKKVASGLLVFSAALLVMSKVIEALGSMDTEVMGQGLVGIGALLAELALFLVVAKFGSMGVMSAVGVLILSQALLVLADAVENFGGMDENVIIKGLTAIGAMLAEIALFSAFTGGGLNLVLVSAGMIIMAEAMARLTDVMKSIGEMKWGDIGKGLTVVAAALIMFGVASAAISGLKAGVVGAGLYVMAGAIGLIVEVLKTAGGMKWKEIGKGMTAIAGSLLILSVAMYAMSGCLLGAAAMVVAAGALAILTPQLLLLSSMSLEGIGLALLAMAGAFTVLGLAGLLLAPVIPALLGLAGAIVLIGAGAALCGVGLTLIASGIAAIGVAVGGSGYLLVEFLKALIDLLPNIGTKLGEMIVNLAKALGDGLAEITKAIETILTAVITAIGNVLPLFIDVAVDIVVALAEGLARGIPAIVTAGMELILGVLQGIAANIQAIVEAGLDCVIGFMDGLASGLPDVIESGINLALTFIEGVADGLENNKERIGEAVRSIISTLLTTAVEVIKGGATGIFDAAKELFENVVKGIEENWPAIKEAAQGALDKAKEVFSNIGSALWSAGTNLIQGFIDGIASMALSVAEKAKSVASGAVEAVTNFLGINSPSRVFMEIGSFVGEGFVKGMESYSKDVANTASGLAEDVVNNVKNPLEMVSKLLDGEFDVNPVITPVMDLSDIKSGSKLLSNMIGDEQLNIGGVTGTLVGSVGRIQNGNSNADVVKAINELKEGMNNNNAASYNVNGITYDDGSNVASAVETLVRAARIERRI